MKYEDLRGIIEFIYNGEVSILVSFTPWQLHNYKVQQSHVKATKIKIYFFIFGFDLYLPLRLH